MYNLPNCEPKNENPVHLIMDNVAHFSWNRQANGINTGIIQIIPISCFVKFANISSRPNYSNPPFITFLEFSNLPLNYLLHSNTKMETEVYDHQEDGNLVLFRQMLKVNYREHCSLNIGMFGGHFISFALCYR